jgi:hypothetical protein
MCTWPDREMDNRACNRRLCGKMGIERSTEKLNEKKGNMVLAVGMACSWIALNENTKTCQFGKQGKTGRPLRSFGYAATALCMKEFI